MPTTIYRSRFPDVIVPNVSLTEFVLGRAGAHGARPAFIEAPSGRTISYADFLEQVRRLAAGLSRRGVSKGDVVAIWSPNMPEFAVVFHAVIRLGAILSTVNTSYTPEEAAFQLRDAKPKMLVSCGFGPDRRRASRRAGQDLGP